MSHSKERKEKICLNCNAPLYGRYCHGCGQENIEPKQSAWHLVTHFFYDITHFDGNFFTTLKDLLLKPGFLSRQYMDGKRASFLNPVRMYVFTSAFFFIIFFSIFNLKSWQPEAKLKFQGESIEKAKKTALASAENKEDSLRIESTFSKIQNLPVTLRKDSIGEKNDDEVFSKLNKQKYSSVQAFDSSQQALPANMRLGWLNRTIKRKVIEIEQKARTDKNGFFKEWITTFLHNFPKLLFISLPIFALLLKLLYIRRKQFYYVDHGIFAIHSYIYSFIALLFAFGINYIGNITGWSWLWVIYLAMVLYSLYYFYKAMRNFYRQGRIKTLFKYVLLSWLSLVVILILFLGFLLFSILEV